MDSFISIFEDKFRYINCDGQLELLLQYYCSIILSVETDYQEQLAKAQKFLFSRKISKKMNKKNTPTDRNEKVLKDEILINNTLWISQNFLLERRFDGKIWFFNHYYFNMKDQKETMDFDQVTSLSLSLSKRNSTIVI